MTDKLFVQSLSVVVVEYGGPCEGLADISVLSVSDHDEVGRLQMDLSIQTQNCINARVRFDRLSDAQPFIYYAVGRAKIIRQTFKSHPSMSHDIHSACNFQGDIELLLDEDNGRACTADIEQQLGDLVDELRCQTLRRFIHDEDRRATHEGAAD